MTFKRPEKFKYTDMCIYIDNHVYEEDCDWNLVYEYLYHLTYMFASNGSMLPYKYLDAFGLFAANTLYFRLKNQKQFEVNENGDHKVKRVKSILNYIKSSIYFLVVDFQRSEYCQTPQVDSENISLEYNFDNIVSTSLSGLDLVDFELTMGDVSTTCRKFLETIPYDKNSTMWLNIYTSTMLTFLDMITLTNIDKKSIEHLSDTRHIRQYHYENSYYNREEIKPVIFHLPESMSNYIIVLARQLRYLVGRDLSDILHTKVDNDVAILNHIKKNFVSEVNKDSNEN